MEAAFYPGSFDPITYGHMNIIERALGIFEKVTVLLAVNPQKKSLFTTDQNVGMIREATSQWSRVNVESWDGLIVDYARQNKVRVAVRGLRAVTDFDNEFTMALTNRSLWPEFETVFLMTRSDFMFLSSTVVRQVAQMGGDISAFVPPVVAERLRLKSSRG